MKVKINGDFVELYKILKFEGLANSGGQAKLMIGDGLVSVNGDVETRKRRKIVSGDRIEFDGHQIEIVAAL
jgi:ribosome-associated protein